MGAAPTMPGLSSLSQKKQEWKLVKLYETRIHGLNDEWEGSLINALGLMREIYNKVLSADNLWHFFWEGSYTVIRHLPGTHHAIAKVIYSHDENLTVVFRKGGYEENVKITNKYLEAFVSIFHGYSLLAIEIEDEEFIGILERLNHCFLNMVTRPSICDQFKIVGDSAKTHCGMGWEGLAIQAVAHMRSYTAGWYNRE